jgi:hypothetical protein
MRPRRRKKRRKNINAPNISVFFRLAVLSALCAVLTLRAADKNNKKKAAEAETVIAGTVFHEPGYALPDATVTLVRRDDPKHKKLVELYTNFRGEFTIHVPAGAAENPVVYVVKASAKGYRAEEKEASVALDRVELIFNLEAEKKK